MEGENLKNPGLFTRHDEPYRKKGSCAKRCGSALSRSTKVYSYFESVGKSN